MEAQMRMMSSVGTLYAIVSRTSNAVSQVDWHLYRKPRPGSSSERTEVLRHPALDLWNMPNPFMPRQEFVETFEQHLELAGEGWWLLAYSNRSPLPLEMWPVRPDRMEPVPHPTDFLSGYMYRGPDGQQLSLDLKEAIFLRTPDPLDIYRGLSPIRAIMNDLEGEQAAAEWNRNFFLNSAVPGGVLTTPKRLADDAYNELRDRWAEQHKGVGNAHRVAILEQGLEWTERAFNQRDMEFTSLRTVASEKIREAYGFPLPLLGTATGSNRAVAEAANYVFARWLIVPRLERIKAALNTELLPMFGPGSDQLEFDYEDPVPEDVAAETTALKTRVDSAVALVNAGWNADEVLEAVGLPPLKYGVLTPAPAAPAAPVAPAALPAVPDTPEGLVPLAALSMFNLQRAQKRAAELEAEVPDVEDALRWEVVVRDDDNLCDPCAKNKGKLYRNRAAAYRDYPGGSNYVNCVGEKYGNQCRCKVVKRGRKGRET
jgi:HK97 family phage portal protein